jgi:hypothetical protein
LGFKNVRDWLGMRPLSDTPASAPVDPKRLDRAETLVDLMFGNKSRGTNPAIADSRELQELAKAIADPKVLGLLKSGHPLAGAMAETRSITDKVDDGLNTAQRALSRIQDSFSGGAILGQDDARRVEPLGKEVRTRAGNVYKAIVQAMTAGAE